jgi:hypothetical protein
VEVFYRDETVAVHVEAGELMEEVVTLVRQLLADEGCLYSSLVPV